MMVGTSVVAALVELNTWNRYHQDFPASTTLECTIESTQNGCGDPPSFLLMSALIMLGRVSMIVIRVVGRSTGVQLMLEMICSLI